MPDWKPRNTARARELRNASTPAERHLWRYLNRSQLGAKFTRQMEITPYFADFACRQLRLVVELDGLSHDLNADYDARRDAFMLHKGYSVLRFTNADVFVNTEGVLLTLTAAILELAGGRAPSSLKG